MIKDIPNGVYPTMITPYTVDNKIDYNAVEKLINWYDEKGVAGIFAKGPFRLPEKFKGVVLDQVVDDSAGHGGSSFQIKYALVKINANDLLI